MHKEGQFCYWNSIFRPKSSLLWSKSVSLKKALPVEEFEKKSRPLFTFIFRPKISGFLKDCVLRMQIRVSKSTFLNPVEINYVYCCYIPNMWLSEPNLQYLGVEWFLGGLWSQT